MKRHISLMVALLFTGSAILLISCSSSGEAGERDEKMMTERSDSLTIIQSQNGKLSYKFETPLMEGYGYAKEPYKEFRKGIYIETYNDTTQNIESTLIADYAINFENQKLWEAKGNVRATNAKGQVLETQQLFWNQKTKKIYSNIDSKITEGNDVLYGVGFESDEAFEEWEFRKPRGRLLVTVEPNRDTATNTRPAAPAGGEQTPAAPQPQSDAARRRSGNEPQTLTPRVMPEQSEPIRTVQPTVARDPSPMSLPLGNLRIIDDDEEKGE